MAVVEVEEAEPLGGREVAQDVMREREPARVQFRQSRFEIRREPA